MDEFLNNWEDNCTTEKERLTQLESQIVLVLNKLGKQQSLMQLVPRFIFFYTRNSNGIVR